MAAPPPALTLVVEKGPRKGETRQCAAGSALRVGRVVKGNHLAVRDVGASQQHLAIEFLPPPAARWAVSDLGSSNGSFLNGAPLAPNVPAPLSDGDSIKIGESTVLAVSISSDSDLDAAAAAGPEPRRSSRYTAAATEEEKPPAATRRGARKKAAVAEIPEVENEVPDAVLEEEKARPATRRGGRGKAAAAVPAEETEEVVELRPHVGRKKAEQPPEQEKEKGEKEAPIATRRGGRKKAVEPAELEKEEEKEEAVVVTHCGGRNKTTEPPEPEKEEEAEAPVVTRGRRKKNAVPVAPPPQPPKTRSRRGQGRVTRTTSTRSTVLEDEEVEEEEENEVAAQRELPGNLVTSTAVKDGEEEKGDKVAAGDVEIEVAAKTLEEEVLKGRVSAQCGASDNVGDEEMSGGAEEDDDIGGLVGSGGELGDGVKVKRAGRSSLETMTLGEWFDRMEIYLPRTINEAADKMIAELEEKQKRIHEYIATLGNSSNPY
jgi:pSer/pThr/pTyr-binding forkhead associated (FHA) protein